MFGIQGLQINVFSLIKSKTQGIGWHKAGTNIKYTWSKLNREAPAQTHGSEGGSTGAGTATQGIENEEVKKRR